MKTTHPNKLPGSTGGRLLPLLAALVLAAALALPGFACPRTGCPGCGGVRCAQVQAECPGCGGPARLCAQEDCPYALCPDCGGWQSCPRQGQQNASRRTGGCHGRHGGHHHGGC